MVNSKIRAVELKLNFQFEKLTSRYWIDQMRARSEFYMKENECLTVLVYAFKLLGSKIHNPSIHLKRNSKMTEQFYIHMPTQHHWHCSHNLSNLLYQHFVVFIVEYAILVEDSVMLSYQSKILDT